MTSLGAAQKTRNGWPAIDNRTKKKSEGLLEVEKG